jgi:hypothetical protein
MTVRMNRCRIYGTSPSSIPGEPESNAYIYNCIFDNINICIPRNLLLAEDVYFGRDRMIIYDRLQFIDGSMFNHHTPKDETDILYELIKKMV